MNITIIIPTLSTGGAEQFVVNLANSLSTTHKVTLVTLFESQSNIVKDRLNRSVELFELNSSLEHKFKTAIRLYRILSRLKHDVIHSHLSVPIYLLPYAVLNSDIKYVHTIHNIACYDSPRSFNKIINNIYFKCIKAIPVSITEKVQKSVKSLYNLNSSPIIHNGTPRPTTPKAKDFLMKKIKSIREKYDFILCHIARLDPQKNHELLFSVLKENKNIYVISMGGISDGNRLYAERILSKGAELHNFEYIGVVGNVSDYIHYSDGIIYSSVYEGLPISLIEAMSMGKICISTPAGGISDVVDESIGILSEDHSILAFSKAVNKFSAQTMEQKSKMSNASHQKFKEKYDIEFCMEKYLQIYKVSL